MTATSGTPQDDAEDTVESLDGATSTETVRDQNLDERGTPENDNRANTADDSADPT
jgi:hypothetical protein